MSDTFNALATEKYVSMVTYRRSGKAIATPIWFINKDESIFVFTRDDAWKLKRLKNDSRVQLAPCNGSGKKILGPYINAVGILNPGVNQEEVYSLFRKKYIFGMTIANIFSRIFGTINRRRIIEIKPE